MSNSTYVPGEALALVGRHTVIAVAPAAADDVLRLWEHAATGSDMMAVLDVMGSRGLSAMPAFAAVVWAGAQVRVVVRGDFTVSVQVDGDSVICDGTEVATWSERAFPLSGVGSVTVRSSVFGTGVVGTGVALPLVGGVVHASEVRVGGEAQIDADPISPEASECAFPKAEEPVAARAPVIEPVPEPVIEPEVETGDEADDDLFDPEPVLDGDRELPEAEASDAEAPETVVPTDAADATIVEEAPADEPEPEVVEEAEPEPPSDPALTLAEPDEGIFDDLFGATILGRVPEDAAVRDIVDQVVAPPPAADSSPQRADVDEVDLADRTITPAEFAALRGQRALTPPPPAALRSTATLSLSTGRVVEVERPVLIGRSPRAQRATSEALPIVLVVDDPYVSGTHLEVTFVDGALVATDLSTNGTLLTLPSGVPTAMVKGHPTTLVDGSVLGVTDSITVAVSIA